MHIARQFIHKIFSTATLTLLFSASILNAETTDNGWSYSPEEVHLATEPVFSVPNDISTCPNNPEGMAAVTMISGTGFWLPINHPAITTYEKFTRHPDLEDKNGLPVGCRENPFLMYKFPLNLEMERAVQATWTPEEFEKKGIRIRRNISLMGNARPRDHMLPLKAAHSPEYSLLTIGWVSQSFSAHRLAMIHLYGPNTERKHCQNLEKQKTRFCFNSETPKCPGSNDCMLTKDSSEIPIDAFVHFERTITTYEDEELTVYSSLTSLMSSGMWQWTPRYMIGNGMGFGGRPEITMPFFDLLEFEENLREEVYALRAPELDRDVTGCWRRYNPDGNDKTQRESYFLCPKGGFYSYSNGETQYE